MSINARLEIIIACRASLRALPLLGEDGLAAGIEALHAPGLLTLLRSLSAALVYGVQPGDSIPHALFGELAIELRGIQDPALPLSPIWRDVIVNTRSAIEACFSPGYFASHELISSVVEKCYTTSVRDGGITRRSRQALRYAIERDIAHIRSEPHPAGIAHEPLWPPEANAQPFFLPPSNIQRLQEFDPSFSAWEDWYELRVRGEYPLFMERQIALLPIEILAQGVSEANRRIAEILAGRARRPLNRVRAIFLGHGEAGKTSLIRALHGQTVTEGAGAMTRGVDITTRARREHGSLVNVIETRATDDLTIHYWDFGGQVMVHHTHQFFLRSNCLYVVVLDGRRNEHATEDARYWLEHVRAYANDAPVMLVGNKIDLAPVHIDIYSLKQLFPNIIDFFPISCIQATGGYRLEFQRFSREFFKLLEGPVLTRQAMLTESEHNVLLITQDRAADAPFLDLKSFEELCASKDIGSEGGSSAQLTDLFDKLGIVIYFSDIASLDGLLLNPEWLTRAVNEIMYSDELRESKGILKKSDIARILSKRQMVDHLGRPLTYSSTQADFVIDAMRRFQLLFSPPGKSGELVVPALLAPNQPENDFDRSRAFAYRIRFEGFMPAHVLPSLVVDRNEEIFRGQVWRFGVRLRARAHRAEALIQSDEHARTLTIWVNGEDIPEYLGVLRDRLHQSIGKMTHLKYFEEVHLPAEAAISDLLSGGSWENYRQVKAALWERRSRPTEALPFIATNARQYDLNRIGALLPRMKEQLKILFLAANPTATSRLDLEEELRSIDIELRGARLRDRISFVARHAVRPDDLIRFVREEMPSVVHFSGHGSESGIVFRDDGGEVIQVSGSSLRQFFRGRGVDVLVLNSCSSREQLESVGSAVRALIGTGAALDDDAARRFSVAFYRALGTGLSVGEAFRDGRDATALYGMDDVFVGLGELDITPLSLLGA